MKNFLGTKVGKAVVGSVSAILLVAIIVITLTAIPNDGRVADPVETNPITVVETVTPTEPDPTINPTTPILPDTGAMDDVPDDGETNDGNTNNGNSNGGSNNGSNESHKPITGEADILPSNTEVENGGKEDTSSNPTDSYEDVVVEEAIDIPLVHTPTVTPSADTDVSDNEDTVQEDSASPAYTDNSPVEENVGAVEVNPIDKEEYSFDVDDVVGEDLWDEFW